MATRGLLATFLLVSVVLSWRSSGLLPTPARHDVADPGPRVEPAVEETQLGLARWSMFNPTAVAAA